MFWTEKCKLVPQEAVYMKVTMGSVVDYFKPLPGVGAGSSTSSSKWCEMLVSNNKHMWSADGLSWRIPKYWGSSMGLGGSVEFWPKDNVIGDGRRHLSFWGHKDDSCGVCSAGCCSNALNVPGSTTTWVPHTLSVEFDVPAVTGWVEKVSDQGTGSYWIENGNPAWGGLDSGSGNHFCRIKTCNHLN